ncbi:anti-FecI sigma factor, FecR [Allomuricauda ruestringensis DSM 13258]|uniref:Anti-FecI sigma factor, FecR n=1 Tax=Allomuricauda ruestringensis (strain DSM 13258 / CIP 107369 / LMG 19739 / B1) TaxID=886377 RepID=G2PN17_ALLRU|nr:FecR domain-containing protein [Allomuricauda ruestringensis]AEM72365.1 anti-FecI sigma factor, FecR [Allomuricauda ruestringensis DSM 13258]
MLRDFGKLIELAKKLARTILLRERIDEVDTSEELNQDERDYIMQKLAEPSHWLERSRLKKEVDETHAREWERLRANTVADSKLRYLKIMVKVAAIFIGIAVCTYFFSSGNFTEEGTGALPEQESITLELENGAVEKLSKSDNRLFKNSKGNVVGMQKFDQLDYTQAEERSSSSDSDKKPMGYHKLTVPYGKTFQLVLSDGTRVHLNAGTSLKYPVRFIKDKNREVFMEGEAFFDVQKNKEQPFIVNSGSLGVQVLGTQFVISSYPEDAFINTVLLEGSVGLYKNKGSQKKDKERYTMLEPGFMGAWNKEEENIAVTEVDTDIYTAWTKGRMVFSHMKFEDIIKKLARCYNVSITNNNVELGEETFTATFDIKIESMEDILESFKRNYGFDYDIENDKINIY